MNIKQILEKFSQLNEFLRKDAGEDIAFDNAGDAINKLKNLYDKGIVNAICVDAITLNYDNQEYKVSVVLGGVTITKNNTLHYDRGMNHSLKYHANKKVAGEYISEEKLIGAMKNTEAAFNKALKNKNVKMDKKTHKIMFSDGAYTYIICLARNEDEITYLHNVFKPNNPKKYFKNVKRRT